MISESEKPGHWWLKQFCLTITLLWPAAAFSNFPSQLKGPLPFFCLSALCSARQSPAALIEIRVLAWSTFFGSPIDKALPMTLSSWHDIYYLLRNKKSFIDVLPAALALTSILAEIKRTNIEKTNLKAILTKFWFNYKMLQMDKSINWFAENKPLATFYIPKFKGPFGHNY